MTRYLVAHVEENFRPGRIIGWTKKYDLAIEKAKKYASDHKRWTGVFKYDGNYFKGYIKGFRG